MSIEDLNKEFFNRIEIIQSQILLYKSDNINKNDLMRDIKILFDIYQEIKEVKK
jgi:hypothetical protein